VSLYKRGKVYWSAIWIDGVRQMRSLETANRRRAEEMEQRWREELHTQRFQLPNYKPEMPLAELWARFLAEGDVKAYHQDRAKMLLPFFAEMPIGQITKNDVARYRKQRHSEYLKKQDSDDPKPLSETTINRDVEVIRHLLFWAADEGFIAANPIARIRTPRERGKRRPVLSVSDEQRLLQTCSDHLRPIVTAALDTGLRRGELLNQDWRDVDFDRKVLSITHSKTAEGEHRLIPLTTRLYAMLEGMRQISGLIFTYEGQPLRRIKTGWAGALRRAGIPYLRFHDLRHTFNSRLADLGVIADVRKELMGHSRGGDVHSLYTHIELPTLREAINRLDAWHTEKVRAPESSGETNAVSHDHNAKHQTEQQTNDSIEPSNQSA
jgi:integrase